MAADIHGGAALFAVVTDGDLMVAHRAGLPGETRSVDGFDISRAQRLEIAHCILVGAWLGVVLCNARAALGGGISREGAEQGATCSEDGSTYLSAASDGCRCRLLRTLDISQILETGMFV